MLDEADFRAGPCLGYPPCTWYGVVQDSYDGNDDDGTISITEGKLVIVQGDQAGPSDEWIYGVVAGQTGLIPSAYIEPLPRQPRLVARVLYDFDAAVEIEMSCEAGELIDLLPSPQDPAGWCTACQPAPSTPRRSAQPTRRGLVPQTFLAPVEGGASPASPPSTSPAAIAPPVVKSPSTPSATTHIASAAAASQSTAGLPSPSAASPSLVDSQRSLSHDEHGRLVQPDEEVAGYITGQWTRRKTHAQKRQAFSTSRVPLHAVPPPPSGFVAAEAMDSIFQLGWLIAKGERTGGCCHAHRATRLPHTHTRRKWLVCRWDTSLC